MVGVASQFGIDEDQLSTVVRRCAGDGCSRYAGLFLYAGSQNFSASEIIENTRYLYRLANKLYSEGLPSPRILDFGGGFGVPENESQAELNLEHLHDGLNLVFSEELERLMQLGLSFLAY
jgi:diaminopimelate decarboxylase